MGIDPRTGLVSPQAVARDSALERGELPMCSGPRRAMTDQARRWGGCHNVYKV